MIDTKSIMQNKMPQSMIDTSPGATRQNMPDYSPSQATKTAYQQFFSQPVQQEWKLGDQPTTYGQALATINNMARTDQAKAMEKLNLLNQYRTQPGNMWYDPFAAATNNAVSELASYGIDPASLTADWFNANTSWQGYLNYNGTTTTPSKPGKKASEQEKVAYALYQFQKSMDTTSAAKSEWAAAQNEINYWANRKDLNLSDDEIISRVFGSNKYSTLGKMDTTRSSGAPLELNEAIDYNPDSVRGAIWAARNGGGTGNARQDIANYYSKAGNVWQANEDISAKLNKQNVETYSPYEVGMAGKDMDEAGAYFGVSSFAPGSIDALRANVDWNDATSVKMFQKVVDAEQDTLKAEEELANFNKLFENRMKRGFASQEEADKWIDDQLNSGAYNTLKKMDAGILKGEPMNLTRAVPYRKQMFQSKAADAIANPPKSGSDVLDSYGANTPDATKATAKVEDEKISSSIDAIGDYLTTDEKDYLSAIPGVEFSTLVSAMGGVKGAIEANAGQQYGKVNGEYGKAYLGAIPIVDQYEKYRAEAERLNNKIIEFEQAHRGDMLSAADVEPEANVRLSDGTMAHLVYDPAANQYVLDGLSEESEAARGEAQQIVSNANERLLLRSQQIGDNGEASPELKAELEQIKKDKEQLNTLYEWIGNHSEEYNAARRSVEDAKMKRDAIGEIAAGAVGAEYDPTVADSIIDFVGGFYQYEAPPMDGFTLVDETTGMSSVDIKDIVKNNNAHISDLKFALAALGDNVPEALVNKLNGAIADAEKENRICNSILVTNDANFDTLAEEGRKKYEDVYNGGVSAGSSKNWWGFLSADEQKIYYALAARDGIEAADQFYADIRDEVMQRRQNQINGVTEQIASSGWLGRFASEVGAVLLSPINTLAGAAYSAGVALGADESEMRAAKQGSHISQSMHSANMNELKTIYGEDTALGQFLTGLYEIIYNRGNSLMNALTWGKFMPKFAGDGKLVGFFNDVLSATPIALSAASDALENAIDRGANSMQQAIIFASTFMAESFTEGIEFGHIEKAGKLLMTKEGFKTFFKDYLPTAFSEVVGESLNDLIENAADEWVKYIDNPDYKSQHTLAIEDVMAKDKTLTPEQAEAIVHEAEVASVLHTAVISFFSPGADIAAMAGNTLTTYTGYALEARDYNQNATGKHAKKKSIRDIRLEHEAAEAAAREAKENPQPVAEETAPVQEQQAEQAEQPEQYPVNGPDATRTRSYTKAMNEYDSNIILLEEAIDANATAQAAAIASAIETGNPYTAQAAAAKLNLGMVQAMFVAGRQNNINMTTLAQGIQLAALGNGECANILNNGVANGLSATEMATQLAAAVAVDMQNEGVLNGVAAGIHDARVNEEFKRLMASGMAEDAIKAQQEIDTAREQTETAQQEYEQKTAELEAARNGVSEAAAAIAEDPINDGNQLTGALAKMTSAAAVAEEYAQRLDKAQKNQQKVEENNKKTIEATTAYMRMQAENTVAEQEKAEAQARADAEAQAQAEAQAAAIAEDEARQQGNMDRVDADTFIEQTHPNATEEQKEQIRATFQKVKEQMGKTADAHLARRQFEERFAKRFGLTVKHVDSVDRNGQKFTLFNARINPKTGELLVNKNATQDDVFYAVLIHEITHLAENNEGYTELADAILQMTYGEGVTFDGILDQMAKGDLSSRLAQDILGKKGLYDKQLGQNHTNREMLQEIIADGVGRVISGDQAALESLVAEKPSLAKRILDGIRNFLKGVAGIKSPAITQAQQIADMLTAALEGNPAAATGNNVQFDDASAREYLEQHGYQGSEIDMLEMTEGENPVSLATDLRNRIEPNKQQKSNNQKPYYEIRKSHWSDNPVVRMTGHWSGNVDAALRQIGMIPYKDSDGWGFRVKRGAKLTAEQIEEAIKNAESSNNKDSEYSLAEYDSTGNYIETNYEDNNRYSLPVENPETLAFLDEQEKNGDVTKTYRTMKILDGKLVSPKATLINGTVEGETQLGQWEEAVEHPELAQIDENGNAYFILKENGRTTKARYNPYIHSSNLMLNDQFKGAYEYSGDNKNLGQFVTVECIVPNSESTSGYHAEKAKDHVGWTGWKTGPVATALLKAHPGDKSKTRDVFLSRWIKPVRIVPDSEVAQHYKQLLEGTDIEVPANVVNNSLREELKKAGVKIGKPQDQTTKKFEQATGERYSLPSDETLAQQIQQWLNENGLEDANLSADEASDLYNRLPKDGKEGNGVRQWAVKGAQASDELDEAAKRYVFNNRFYKKQTNAEQLANAIRWMHSNASEEDPTGYQRSLEIVMDDNFEYRTAEGQAQMIAVIGMAAARNDTYAQVALADAYDRQGTDLGRALQLRNIWRLMTPEGRKKSLKNMVDKMDMELKRKGKHVNLTLSDWIYDAAAMAEDEGEMERVRKAAKQELAEQLPANWKDRLHSFRIFAMLANPKTHVRNIIGNLLFMPAVSMKNKIGAVMELAKPKGERTKTLALRVDSDIRAFARQDANNRQDELTGDSRWKEGDSVKREQKPFTGKWSWLQKGIDANSKALEWEDWIFLRGHYARALGGWMQANGYSVADMEEHPELLEKGRAYAQSEAQKATYRDFNSVAAKLNQLARNGGPIGFIVEATLPFKKTPANIVKRGMEYSVFGLAKSISTDLYHLHQYNVAKANGETIMPDKAITPNEFIDHLSAGLTGTAVMALGAFLSSLGIVTVGLDDDDDKFEKTKGGQEYALKIKIGDDDVTYTLDWAAPMCMPFFVGASIFEQLSEENDGLTLREFINSASSIAEPVFNLSMLDGVNSLLRTNSYAGAPEITQILGKIASNYATSFVPAAVGTFTRIFDDQRRKAFVKSGEGVDLTGTWLYAWEQTENKIYPLARTNIPYRNIWGEAEGDAPLERVIENIASPGYFARTRKDPIIDEMERLYSSEDVSETKRKSLVPKMPNGKVNDIALEPEQYDRITVERGQTAKKVLTDLLNSQFYKAASDNEKATMVSEAWDYATQIADNVVMGKKLESWVSNSRTNPVQGIINRQKDRNISDAKKDWKAEAVKAVQMEDYEALDVCIEALNELGVSVDSIKTAVGNAYKPEYIRAYQTGDRQKMIEIESILDMSGLGFDKVNRQGMDTYDQWIADMNKQVEEEEI